MHLYNQLKAHPDMDFYPRTFIFGAKASAGYRRAKAIIKLINNVGEVINNDKTINDKIKVVFIEDYRVSNAEIIFAASDIMYRFPSVLPRFVINTSAIDSLLFYFFSNFLYNKAIGCQALLLRQVALVAFTSPFCC
jgi:hypothetical protein